MVSQNATSLVASLRRSCTLCWRGKKEESLASIIHIFSRLLCFSPFCISSPYNLLVLVSLHVESARRKYITSREPDMFSNSSFCPLANVSEDDLQGLVKTLWDWSFCESCRLGPGRQVCSPRPCPGMRWGRLATFFNHYKSITAAYVPGFRAEFPPALQTHNDLFAIIQLLRQNPDSKRSELTSSHFAPRDGKALPTTKDQDTAFNLAFRVMTTITCCLKSRSTDALEVGVQPIPWRQDMSWTEFLSALFPTSKLEDDDPDDNRDTASHRINERVTARRLMKVAGLRFIPTNELNDHLQLNQQDGTVQLYRQTAFLKESLIASQRDSK